MTQKNKYQEFFENQTFSLNHFEGKHHTPLVESVFNKESLNLVYASAGGMKSLLMLDLALALAKGENFLGYPCKQSKVLYIDAEMSDADVGERLIFFKAGNPENLSYMKNGDESFNFKDPEQQEGFIKYLKIQPQPYEVIFFDNLRTMAIFENENDSSQFQIINRFLCKLRDLGTAVFLVHHANKGGEEYAGSSNIITPFNTVFGLVDSGFEHMRKINVTKNRANNKGLSDLNNQLISPCDDQHRMVLNATSYKSDAEIAHAMIDLLKMGNINNHEETKKEIRKLGHQFRSGKMTQDCFISFLKENAEIEHSYTTVKALRGAYKQHPILSEDELLEEFQL